MVELVDVEASERRMCDYDNPEFVVIDVRLLLTNAFDVSDKEKINITITASTGNLTDEVRKWRLWGGVLRPFNVHIAIYNYNSHAYKL